MNAIVSKHDLVELGWSDELAAKAIDIIAQLESIPHAGGSLPDLEGSEPIYSTRRGSSSTELLVKYPSSFTYPR